MKLNDFRWFGFSEDEFLFSLKSVCASSEKSHHPYYNFIHQLP